MRKYRWTLLKTLEFLNSRRPDLEIRINFIQQLSDYEARLSTRGCGPQTSKWNEVADENKYLESEELLLRNTFINSKTNPNAMTTSKMSVDGRNKKNKVRWKDFDGKQDTKTDVVNYPIKTAMKVSKDPV